MTEEHTTEPTPEQKRRYWQAYINSWQRSGLSQLAYCREHGLTQNQFTYWEKKAHKKDHDIAFVPLRCSQNLPALVNPSKICLSTPNGYTLALTGGFDQIVVRQLLNTVRSL